MLLKSLYFLLSPTSISSVGNVACFQVVIGRRGRAMNVVVIVNLCDSATSFGMMTIMSAQES